MSTSQHQAATNRIRAEYLELPGLCLTKPQVERLWGLDPVTSGALLSALVDVKSLRRTRQHAYVRANGAQAVEQVGAVGRFQVQTGKAAQQP